MSEKKMVQSINSVEGVLILSFGALIVGVFTLIGVKFSENSLVYNALGLSLIVLTALIAALGVFQFVKYKYIETVKAEIMEDLDKYMSKADSKVNETNGRIYNFETNYSKKLKKISKDYAVKAKEISDIKKEMELRLLEIDRRAAGFEIEVCNMKIENIEGKNESEMDKEKLANLYNRIIEINTKFSGISTDDYLEIIHSKLTKL